MAFEQSPGLGDDGIKSQQSVHEWLVGNERTLYAITGILVLIVFVMSARVLGIFSGEPGGLDGCVVNATGGPVTGVVQVDLVQSNIPADGCFFFAELSPGSHELIIKISDGSSFKQSVSIVSGQAVGLGTITVP
jgi:hypothetical protein